MKVISRPTDNFTTVPIICVVTLMTMSAYSSNNLCGYTHDNVCVQLAVCITYL